MGLYIILIITLSRFFGIGGLALSTSISATVISVLLIITLRNKIGALGLKKKIISFCKILFASIVMGIIAKTVFNYLNITVSQNLSLLLAIAVGVITYLLLIYFVKIEDVDLVIKAIKKRINEK